MRHSAPAPAEPDPIVRSVGFGLSDRQVLEPHAHPWPQLVFASTGVLTVDAGARSWVVPTARALWVPAGLEHGLRATGSVRMRTLYLHPDRARELPLECAVVGVPPFLRELIHWIVDRGLLDAARPSHRHLADVLVDVLTELPPVPLALWTPRDERARRVADRVLAQPGRTQTLTELAAGSGASRRTLERTFQAETGMTFGRWRQQVRLFRALERLAEGRSVTDVALDVGYDSTSAFIAMFRRALGTTPRQYASHAEAPGSGARVRSISSPA